MDTKKMSKRDLVSEISHVTQLKKEEVNSIINALSDIIIREAVMKGEFTLPNCFSIKTHSRKKRKQYNVQTGKYFEYPKTKVLGITLSNKIKSFHRWKQRNEYNQKHGLTIEDWQRMKDEADKESAEES